jgi:uroporphyrinogen decarboxylase
MDGMASLCVPLADPRPDVAGLMHCLSGEDIPARPPTIEYMIDLPIVRVIATALLGREWVAPGGDRAAQAAYWDNVIAVWYHMGYSAMMLELPLPFRKPELASEDTAPQTDGSRLWSDEQRGLISSWADFEAYVWPKVEDFDFFPFEYVARHLPDGMGLMPSHAGGVFEWVTWIMSYAGLSYALYDDLSLVQAVVEQVGRLQQQFFAHLLDIDNVVVLWPGDDMGFRSGTLVGPNILREYFLPWHRACAAMAHDKELALLFHSCGKLDSIMEDLIDQVGIDAKHSFEDVIMPAAEYQRRYGARVATLGGVDMHVLASAEPDVLRRYVRELIDTCAPAGRFAVGAGNSVANYVPLENYLTMIDEALR